MAQSISDKHIATVVAGYAQRDGVSINDILELFSRLRRIEESSPAQSDDTPATYSRPTPAIPLEQAVTRSMVFCLCCGRGFKMLKRHLGAEHGLTEAEYRAAFDLPESVPLVAPDYSERKADYARKAGLGTHARETTDRDAQVS